LKNETSNIGILLIHGIGIHSNQSETLVLNSDDEENPKISKIENWKEKMKDKIQEKIQEKMPKGIDGMISLLQKNYQEKGGKQELIFKPVHWGKKLQEYEDQLWQNISKSMKKNKESIIRQLMVTLMADIIAYQPTPGNYTMYDEIHNQIQISLKELAEEAGPDADLFIISHSLGTVIIYNFLWNLQHISTDQLEIPVKTPLERGKTLKALYTMGSPLALYSIKSFAQKHFSPEGKDINEDIVFGKPIKSEIWKNFYTPSDIISFPLKHINSYFSNSQIEDIEVEVGNLLTRWNPASHMMYWEDQDVIDIIIKDLLPSVED
jgi:hypothetical protein